MGSVEADDERQIAVADDWQLQRLAHSSSTNTAAPCPGDIGGTCLLPRVICDAVVMWRIPPPNRSPSFEVSAIFPLREIGDILPM